MYWSVKHNDPFTVLTVFFTALTTFLSLLLGPPIRQLSNLPTGVGLPIGISCQTCCPTGRLISLGSSHHWQGHFVALQYLLMYIFQLLMHLGVLVDHVVCHALCHHNDCMQLQVLHQGRISGGVGYGLA